MLKLIQTNLGQFDLAYELAGDDLRQTALKTIIYATVFTDQVASAGRVEDPYDQRGWWFDPNRGTGFWYVRRQALSDSARRETMNMMERALNTQPLLSDITVSEVIDQTLDDQLRNVSRVGLQVEGVYDGDKFRLVLYVLNKAPEQYVTSIWDVAWDVNWAFNGETIASAWDVSWDFEWVL